MAFLCPARIKKEWKKRVQANSRPRDKPTAPGRITGSASMDTLVRVAVEKNNGGRKMIMMVLYDFTPYTDDELGVKRGDRVRVLYRELEWAYAIRDDGVEGFLPWSYLASPAKLSRRAVPGDVGCDCLRCTELHASPVSCMTKKMSSLTLASTKAVQFSTAPSTNDSTDSTDSFSHSTRSRTCHSTSESDSTASTNMDHIRYRPAADNVARLGAYISSTTKLNQDPRKRQASPRVEIPEGAIAGHGTTSGVYTDSDSPRTDSAPSDHSPNSRRQVKPKRITFKPASSDSDSGCERTTKPPKQTRTKDAKIAKTPSHETQLSTSIETFEKQPLGNYLVMFPFEANQENDLSVRPGEFVTALNKDDPDWYWVKTRDGEEGFVPSAYLCDVKGPDLQQDLDCYNADESAMTEDCFPDAPIFTSTPARPTMNRRPMPKKMLILFDYEARQTDDIGVTQGQYVYADMDNQRFLDWIWVYSPVSQKEGFIPREYTKPPQGALMSTEL
ncbi:SH3 domain-containing protein Dlish-like [Lineus longissimus]|uniref:SH3 domain-containing protein Dlish-like n=1 Tax=Lineus longissimus TaxID=88925 RepID=UPI00315E0233